MCLTPSDQVWFSVVPALIVVLNYVQACWLLTQDEKIKKDPVKCIIYMQDLPSWAQSQGSSLNVDSANWSVQCSAEKNDQLPPLNTHFQNLDFCTEANPPFLFFNLLIWGNMACFVILDYTFHCSLFEEFKMISNTKPRRILDILYNLYFYIRISYSI